MKNFESETFSYSCLNRFIKLRLELDDLSFMPIREEEIAASIPDTNSQRNE